MKAVTLPPRQAMAKEVKNTSGQGKVFSYDEKAECGAINGFDRIEYTFLYAEWRNKNEKPKVGMIVNFEIKDHEAISIKIR
jgi:hypothetical protein